MEGGRARPGRPDCPGCVRARRGGCHGGALWRGLRGVAPDRCRRRRRCRRDPVRRPLLVRGAGAVGIGCRSRRCQERCRLDHGGLRGRRAHNEHRCRRSDARDLAGLAGTHRARERPLAGLVAGRAGVHAADAHRPGGGTRSAAPAACRRRGQRHRRGVGRRAGGRRRVWLRVTAGTCGRASDPFGPATVVSGDLPATRPVVAAAHEGLVVAWIEHRPGGSIVVVRRLVWADIESWP